MRLNEFDQPVGESKHRDVKFRDPELIKTQQFVRTHYPTYGADPEVAFDKWTQRALKHSEEQDEKHNEILQQLSNKIAELEAEIGDLKSSEDLVHEEQLDELSFMGSQCTKDCSGHRAGYEWSKRKGRVHAASWSPSFNNGAAIAVSGK